ncbi:hypothetical protein PENSUB_7344 [Penicillium subrubescens]|jgi:hypothetical protein|uniref:Uncharacterized protein n=1 Tax=Penicillium subrubescens TaxID=1316194 RepID=A0A1Q5TMB3_9EURO|nr:hypothetical protein PENSUB_7344 [Penicillium subrubescens]
MADFGDEPDDTLTFSIQVAPDPKATQYVGIDPCLIKDALGISRRSRQRPSYFRSPKTSKEPHPLVSQSWASEFAVKA